MSRTWDDCDVLYKETDEEAQIRREQEAEATRRINATGTHFSPTGKGRGSFKRNTKVKVDRVKKIHVDTSSKLWKDYLDKKITFAELKKALAI